jgi:dihydroflavonol-4-reductase
LIAPGAGVGGPILVTGATGFLGRALVQELVRRGTETHALAREGSPRGPLEALPITWHAGDLRDEAAIETAVASITDRAKIVGAPARILHAAALISYRTRDRALAREVNVRGTERLLETARRHGVGRFLQVSSVVTVGSCIGPEPLDETASFNLGGLGVDYVDTKRAAEEIVLASARTLDAVVVNPGAIFGPVERTSNTVRTIRRIAEGRTPPFLPPGSVGVVGVEDAAQGTLLALARGRSGERYILVESSLGTSVLFARIAGQLGVPAKGRVLSRGSWRILTSLASMWDFVFPMSLTPPQALTMLGQDLRFDAKKARTELGWSPRPFDEVLAGTIAYLRTRGELEPPRSR